MINILQEGNRWKIYYKLYMHIRPTIVRQLSCVKGWVTMVSDADISSGYSKDSHAEPARRQAEGTAEILDDMTAQKIMNTIRASRNFIDDAELAKQCRAVIEF